MNTTAATQSRFIDVIEAAGQIAIECETLVTLCHKAPCLREHRSDQPIAPCFRDGTRYVVKREAIEDYIDRNTRR